MTLRRIHVLGASGSGTTTLARASAERLGYRALDTDDFYWAPTDPPFRVKRDVSTRLDLLGAELRAAGEWVLSGSLAGWGDPLVPLFELVVFLELAPGVRLARLRARERQRYGAERIAPGGDMHEEHEAFIAWAAEYDDGGLSVRSRRLHEEWLAGLPDTCVVLRLDSAEPVAALVDRVAERVVR